MLQSTVVNPYLLLLIILVIGGAATVPMVIYDTYNQLWMAWVLPYICICQVTNRALLSTLDPHVFLCTRKPVRVL